MEHNVIFLNNKDMENLGVSDMDTTVRDVERVYSLYAENDVILPDKCVMRWGKTAEDENRLGRINAMAG